MACCHNSACSSGVRSGTLNSPKWRRALWIALGINAGFFLTEIVTGAAAGSAAMQADALDFFGDAANYAISLGGVAALIANGGVALMLYRFRSGDANMRSVWICSRNDAIGNLAVLFAALGVFGTDTGWPDVIVAAIMGGLGLWGGWQIVGQAQRELRHARISPVVLWRRSRAASPVYIRTIMRVLLPAEIAVHAKACSASSPMTTSGDQKDLWGAPAPDRLSGARRSFAPAPRPTNLPRLRNRGSA